jgi:hypothetical protein
MAEVFSVVAAAIGLVDLAGRSSYKLPHLVRDWRHAPTLILALVNETADIQVLLSRLQDAGSIIRNQPQTNAILNMALESEIKKATQCLCELEALVVELSQASPAGKKRKWVQKKSQAADLQGRLRTVRVGINDLFMTHLM